MVLPQTYRIKMHQSVRVIFNLRAQVVLPLWQSWSKLTVFCFFLRCEFVWQAVSSLHSLWLFLISMHSSLHSLVTWWQISIGWTSFVLKNRITTWTSHAVVVSNGSSIAYNCRAKIENFSRLSDGLLEKWERNKHGCVTTSPSTLETLLLWYTLVLMLSCASSTNYAHLQLFPIPSFSFIERQEL